MPGARTVLFIPYHNRFDRLLDSVASIGPEERCDLLIVDDGSTEPLDAAAVAAAFRAFGEVFCVVLPRNVGVERARNAGLEWIEARDYEFVALLDRGDLNVPHRIAVQEDFLDAHPEVLLVGGSALFVDEAGAEQFVYRLPVAQKDIAAMMRRNLAFLASTVMFRTSALPLVGHYPLDTPAAEDYEFFWRFVELGGVANLPDVLVEYELDPGGISLSRRRAQLASRLKIQRDHSDGSWQARRGILLTKVMQRLPYGLVYRVKHAVYSRRTSANGSSGGADQ